MDNKITDELLSTMDIIRALHMANNDVTAAINIIFDTATPKSKERSDFASSPKISSPEVANSKPNGGDCPASSGDDVVGDVEMSAGSEWWLVGCGEVTGLSTCRGRRIKAGDEVDFTFPLKIWPSPGKVFGRGRPACSEIVRFSTTDSGEIGRIPKEWARCLLPLVRDKKVKIEGHCKSAPDVLSVMDTILLCISVYINSSMFLKQKQTSLKAASNSTEETVVHPLPTLFQLLGPTPFQKNLRLVTCTRERALLTKRTVLGFVPQLYMQISIKILLEMKMKLKTRNVFRMLRLITSLGLEIALS